MTESPFRRASASSVEKSGSLYRFVASTPDVDSYGDIVEQDWDFSRFHKNAPFLWAHDRHQPSIGVVEHFGVIDGVLQVAVRFSEVNALARQLKAQIDEGTMKAVSVGFEPLELERIKRGPSKPDGIRFIRSSLHEISLVTIGANPNALLAGKGAFVRSPEEWAWIESFEKERAARAAAPCSPPPAESSPLEARRRRSADQARLRLRMLNLKKAG